MPFYSIPQQQQQQEDDDQDSSCSTSSQRSTTRNSSLAMKGGAKPRWYSSSTLQLSSSKSAAGDRTTIANDDDGEEEQKEKETALISYGSLSFRSINFDYIHEEECNDMDSVFHGGDDSTGSQFSHSTTLSIDTDDDDDDEYNDDDEYDTEDEAQSARSHPYNHTHKTIAALYKAAKTQQSRGTMSILILGNATGRTTKACIRNFTKPTRAEKVARMMNREASTTTTTHHAGRQPAQQYGPHDPYLPTGKGNHETLVYLFCPDMKQTNPEAASNCEQVIEGNVNSLVDLERALEISRPDHIVCIWNDDNDYEKEPGNQSKPRIKMPWNKKSARPSRRHNDNQALTTTDLLDQIHRRYLKTNMCHKNHPQKHQARTAIRKSSSHHKSVLRSMNCTKSCAMDALMRSLWEYQHLEHPANETSRPHVWMMALPQHIDKTKLVRAQDGRNGQIPIGVSMALNPQRWIMQKRNQPALEGQDDVAEEATENVYLRRRQQQKYHWKAAREAACLQLSLKDHHPHMRPYVTVIQVQQEQPKPGHLERRASKVLWVMPSPAKQNNDEHRQGQDHGRNRNDSLAVQQQQPSCSLGDSNNANTSDLFFVTTTFSSAEWMAQQIRDKNDGEGEKQRFQQGTLMHLNCMAYSIY
eukprot:CAMPEP_0168779590 /NCGR_PEP_ID=MMETSP0725-20121227/7685_1 /TAXON_ID=265536 /ORGANISM="Amphiprora sp., Strain CCMP467" /LENGTH=640 /DNA_ID=CAMNT_0008829413 /DNA_START=386 /DNA_END=2308 /DNA_ORIENTATION=-